MYHSLHSRARGRSILRLTGLWLALTASVLASQLSALDVTSQVQSLGIPYNTKPAYARNVWDLQVFGNRLYIGAGNSSNLGPSQNAGIGGYIRHLDLGTDTFVQTTNTIYTECQLDVFRILNGVLYIPGHDPVESHDLGNYYRLDTPALVDGWAKYRNIPKAIHTYDMYRFNNRLFAALGTQVSGSVPTQIQVSDDNGQTWQSAISPTTPADTYIGRVNTLFEVNNTLYGSTGNASFGRMDPGSSVFVIDGKPTLAQAFPNAKSDYMGAGFDIRFLRVVRPVNFNNKLVYISAVSVNDHQWQGVNLYTAADLDQAQVVPLPTNLVPWDLLVRSDAVYALLSQKVEATPDRFIIKVIKSTDLVTWQNLFEFEQPTFARSFEEVNGDFYLGLGTDVGTAYADIFYSFMKPYTDDIRPESGTILRVKRAAYASANTAPTLSALAALIMNEDTTKTVSFTVGDTETAAGSLVVTATSSNTAVVPAARLTLGGSGANRTLTITPAANANGSATITVSVCDAGNLTTSRSFALTVVAVNDKPVATAQSVTTAQNTAKAITLAGTDVEGSALTYAIVTNPAHGALTGSGANRTYTPATNYTGADSFSFTVNDGSATSTSKIVSIMVTATNTAPTLSALAALIMNEDTTKTVSFTVGDTETAAGSLVVTATSSNTAVVPAARLTLGGSGASRTLTITPAANANGSATITVSVRDAGNLTTSRSFALTVVAVNDKPTISAIANCVISAGAYMTIPFTVSDIETAAGSLVVTATSSNTAVVPVAGLELGGSGANRDLAVTPAAGASGSVTITVSVSDAGNLTASTSFTVSVVAEYTLSADFSSTQGLNHWSYQQWDGTAYSDMTWNPTANAWIGAQNWCRVRAPCIPHPAANAAVVVWTAPAAGALSIDGTVRKLDTGGGDGVQVRLMKNGTQVWPISGWQAIAYNDSIGYRSAVNVSVVPGDRLYFVVQQGAGNAYDAVAWDPTITYGTALPVGNG